MLRRWHLSLSKDEVGGEGGLAARLSPGQTHDQVAAEINRALVEQGIGVFAIGARERSLEGLYHQVTENTHPLSEAA